MAIRVQGAREWQNAAISAALAPRVRRHPACLGVRMLLVEVREQGRVHDHILAAEREARARSSPSLDPWHQLARRWLLEELAAYRRVGRYPRNRGQSGRHVPIFVDASGTRCAMAHLLEISGQAALVAKIARRRNLAWLPELADEPGLLSWLAASGLTLDEAARIQPSYCTTTAAACGLCETSTVRAYAEGVVTEAGASQDGGAPSYASVRIERISDEPRLAIGVGDEVQVQTQAQAGDRLLVLLQPDFSVGAAPAEIRATSLEHAFTVGPGTVTCNETEFSREHPLSLDLLFASVEGSSVEECRATLRAHDARWTRTSCTDSSYGCAQSLGPVGTAESTAAFAICLALLAYRRRVSAR